MSGSAARALPNLAWDIDIVEATLNRGSPIWKELSAFWAAEAARTEI
jgi:hypothetical protein